MNKIKTLIAHNNTKIIDNIQNDIQKLEYVEIVGSAKTGKETCNKIVELKPEIVFVEYNMGDMNALEMMEKTADSLGKDEAPEFKFISKDILEENKNDKYEIKKKANKKKKIKETATVKGMNTQGIIEILEKYAQEN